jgi:DNA repair photolyase
MRWSQQSLHGDPQQPLPGYRDAVVRHFDAPEAIDTRFYEVRAKTILNRVPEMSQVPFRWTVNPYRGCTHACTYCFARPTHEFLGWDAGRDFEREIVVKVNAPERLRAELARSGWQGEHVALGTNTDPYQWVEGRYELMRGIWAAFLEARNPCSVLTKSPLLLRDLDLMRQLNRVTEFSAALSIPTLEPRAWRQTEPRTPNPRARLEALAELSAAGIRTGVLVAPLMPGINDSPEQVAEVVRLATEAGADYISGIALHLRRGVREVFMGWLSEHRPDLTDLYEDLYRRGAYAPPAERRRLAALIDGPLLSARQRDWRLQGGSDSTGRPQPGRAERQSNHRRGVPTGPREPSAPTLF